ncbi:MAG: extracellular solute-binding protein [Clostridiales bacterium]|nr:extracellular solute-binding protein [Clostridiales bacterium]
MKLRKIIAILFAAIMVFGLAACTAGSKGPVEITFSFWGSEEERASTEAVLEQYNALQDKVVVKPMYIGRDQYVEKLNTMATGGGMPDCGMIAEDSAIGMARNGLMSNIDLYEGQESKPLDCIIFKDAGNPVAYSTANEILALWYNKELFDKAGVAYPPATLDKAWSWDEFIEVSKQLTFDANGLHPGEEGFDKNNIVQYGCYVNQYTWQLEVWALSNGGRWFSEDGTSIVFDNAAVEAMQKVFDLHLVHNVAPFINGTVDAGFSLSLGTGNVAMCTEGQWATGFGGDIDYGVGVLPYMKEKANICTGGAIGMFAQTKHPTETAEFLRWYGSEDFNFGAIEAGWWMPTKLNWYTDPALLNKWIFENERRTTIGADNYKTAFVDVCLADGVVRSTGWYYTPNTTEVLYQTLQPALVEAINGSKTAAQVIGEIRAALEAALAGG